MLQTAPISRWPPPRLVCDDDCRGGRKASRVCRGRDYDVLGVHARGGQDCRPAAERCCRDDGDWIVCGDMPRDLLDDVVGKLEAERRAWRTKGRREALLARAVDDCRIACRCRCRNHGHADGVAGLAPRARRVEKRLRSRQPFVPR
jgi:hypothetical protein